jgi:hypothetical protein
MHTEAVERYVVEADGEPFECRYIPPVAARRGCCVFVQSGQAGPIDEPTPENALYGCLTERLAECGVGSIRFDLRHRPDRSVPATPAQFAARVRRLERVLAASAMHFQPGCPVLLGTSLGADAILAVLATPNMACAAVSGLVLIGCVLDEPLELQASVGQVAFVYGADDFIAYADSRGRMTVPQRPHAYAPATAQRLRGPGLPVPTTHILDGLGHTLRPSSQAIQTADPTELLAQLVAQACLRRHDEQTPAVTREVQA